MKRFVNFSIVEGGNEERNVMEPPAPAAWDRNARHEKSAAVPGLPLAVERDVGG